MKKTPLNAAVKRLNPKMTDFFGWELASSFEGISEEHNAVRNYAGIFDVSHMGELEFGGTDALPALQKLLCRDISKLSINQAMYAAMLYPNGGFVDDLLVHKISENRYLFCVNASNTIKDYEWSKQNISGDVEVINTSDMYAQIAVQGPDTKEFMPDLIPVAGGLKKYWFEFTRIGPANDVLIARTGYTGEKHGFELYVTPTSAEYVWNRIFEAASDPFVLKPAGLGARDTLRLEAGMRLYGNDIDETNTPFEADLGWIVSMDKEDFIGKDALQKQLEEGIKRKLVGFELVDRGVARQHHKIFSDEKEVGEVTSGTITPYFKKPIGMGYVPIDLAKQDTRFDVKIRDKFVEAKILPLPFYKPEN